MEKVSTEKLSFASLVVIAKELCLSLNLSDLRSIDCDCSLEHDEEIRSSFAYDRVLALIEILANLYKYRPLPF